MGPWAVVLWATSTLSGIWGIHCYRAGNTAVADVIGIPSAGKRLREVDGYQFHHRCQDPEKACLSYRPWLAPSLVVEEMFAGT